MKKLFWMALLAAVVSVALVGCGGSSSDDGGGDSKFVGTWALSRTSGGSTYWYIFFNADGTYRITDNADGSGQRVYGNYTVSGNTAKGNMVNPRVGVGEIDVLLESDATLFLDFIEHWHSPYKHVPYFGTKR